MERPGAQDGPLPDRAADPARERCGPENGAGRAVTGAALYTLPPGVPVARSFVRGFRRRHGDAPPERIARMLVLVNTPRAGRAVEEALAAAAGGPGLLPRIETLAGLGADPLAAPDLPPAIAPLRRELRLLRLVERYLAADRAAAAPPAAAPALAEALAGLLDEMDEAGLAADSLEAAVEAGTAGAAHWARLLDFVDIVRRAWPAIRAEDEAGAMDPKARQRAAVDALIERWQAAPPAAPVIAAGSTGAVASTARLLAAIARLPGGAVVLPGLDPELPRDIWAEIAAGRAPDHPQAPFARLLLALDMAPGDVRPWAEAPASPRRALITEALRPAPVSDAWTAALPALAGGTAAAAAGLTLVEAPTPRAEAGAVALAIRRALDVPERRVLLVTPDAALARRVTAELARFAVTPDDSLGRPLAQTPPAVFLRLVLAAAGPGTDATTLAALLAHPVMRAGAGRAAHLARARDYERAVLRGPLARPAPGRLPARPPRTDESDAARDARAAEDAWRAEIEDTLAPLAAALARAAPLAETLAAHRAAAEALSGAGPDGTGALWSGSDGAALGALLDELAGAADAHGAAMASYPALLQTLLAGREVRPEPTAPHPRVAILGPREARMEDADLVILAGLAEGTWPALPGADPWLSRPMRARLALPSPETRIGLSAHDFYHAALRGEVILTRAARSDAGPLLPSRWLTRLTTLMQGVADGAALEGMRARGQALLAHLPAIHGPGPARPPAPRPMPRPDVLARPRRLSVTEIETLVRDAYAIYARHVLGLAPLDPPGRARDARDRGTVFHTIMEEFARDTAAALPAPGTARAALMAAADRVLAEAVPEPDLRRVWRARLARVADWFVAAEAERRARARPAALEARGTAVFPAPAGDFTLVAKADRIDLREDGRAEILDYKTGQPPSRPQIAQGFNQQLHLQAAILAAGGFGNLGPREAAAGAFVGLTGAGAGGKVTEIADLAGELADHRARFLALIAAYDAGAPYISRGRAETLRGEGDYDHLARRDEWEGEDP